MSTLVLGERPPELEQLLARRRARGQDLFDEVWEGSYHVAPAPSAHGRVGARLAVVLHPPAEVVSPGDQSSEKFASYAARNVDEVLIADPSLGTVRLWRLRDGRYDETPRSALLDLDVVDVVDWS